MSRLGNYGSLCMTLAARIKNEDAIAFIPEFVELAEADLRIVLLQSRYVTERTTINTIANNCSIALPALMARPLSASINGNALGRVQSSTMQCNSSYKGVPEFYGLDGVDKIRLYPMPDAIYPVEVVHIPEITPLVTAGTNWLLTKMPNAYLYGAMAAAKDYLGESDYAQALSLYQRAVSQLIDADVTTMPAIMQQTNLGG